jgi:hypothetical protein
MTLFTAGKSEPRKKGLKIAPPTGATLNQQPKKLESQFFIDPRFVYGEP